jgi:hypothetical protein
LNRVFHSRSAIGTCGCCLLVSSQRTCAQIACLSSVHFLTGVTMNHFCNTEGGECRKTWLIFISK